MLIPFKYSRKGLLQQKLHSTVRLVWVGEQDFKSCVYHYWREETFFFFNVERSTPLQIWKQSFVIVWLHKVIVCEEIWRRGSDFSPGAWALIWQEFVWISEVCRHLCLSYRGKRFHWTTLTAVRASLCCTHLLWQRVIWNSFSFVKEKEATD